jgi:hypothetical protein
MKREHGGRLVLDKGHLQIVKDTSETAGAAQGDGSVRCQPRDSPVIERDVRLVVQSRRVEYAVDPLGVLVDRYGPAPRQALVRRPEDIAGDAHAHRSVAGEVDQLQVGGRPDACVVPSVELGLVHQVVADGAVALVGKTASRKQTFSEEPR